MTPATDSKTITSKVELISPKMAKQYLATMRKNRAVSERAVLAYADAMKNDKWHFHGQPIQFDVNGKLVDGQHRLRAIVESGETIKMLVVRGVSDAAVNLIDTGRRRTAAHQLAAEGCIDSNATAAAILLLSNYDSGTIGHNQVKINNADIITAWRAVPGIDASREYSHMIGKILPRGIGIWAHFIFARIDADAAKVFFQHLASGSELKAGSPILLLRNRLIELRMNKTVRPNRTWLCAIIVKAWNAFRNGSKLDSLKWDVGSDKKAQEAFPKAI